MSKDRLDIRLGSKILADLTKYVSGLEAKVEELMKEKFPMGAACGQCGFRYWAHKDHIIPCPRCEAEQLRRENQEQDADLNTINAYNRDANLQIATLREEIGAVENVVNTYVEDQSLPHDRVFRLGQRLEALETAIKTALKKLNWMLAPGQTRKEAVEILTEALATAQDCDCESVILKADGHRVDCPLNEAEMGGER